ncbi:putative meiosis regulator and mRNA stability factor 1 [Helianthus debilis subsp. tardiflorus]
MRCWPHHRLRRLFACFPCRDEECPYGAVPAASICSSSSMLKVRLLIFRPIGFEGSDRMGAVPLLAGVCLMRVMVNSGPYPFRHGMPNKPQFYKYPPLVTNPDFQPPSSSELETPGCPKPSENDQDLTKVIVSALATLKCEKIMPTEANIVNCIRYGKRNQPNIDVKKALKSALKQQLVVKQTLGSLPPFFVGKCVNLKSNNIKDHSKATWDELQKFLSTPAGRSAITASQCR